MPTQGLLSIGLEFPPACVISPLKLTKRFSRLGVVAQAFNLSSLEAEVVDLCELKGYVARATE